MNPVKYLRKAIIIEMGIMAAPFLGGVAGGVGAAGVSAAATAGIFGGSLLSTLSTGFSIFSTLAKGKAESQDYKIQAKAEESNARDREISRKRNLIRTLALQNVRQGASGITGGTGSSAQAVQLEDIDLKQGDTISDTGATSQRVNQLKQNAKSATTFSLLSAAGEGVRYGKRVAKRGSL